MLLLTQHVSERGLLLYLPINVYFFLPIFKSRDIQLKNRRSHDAVVEQHDGRNDLRSKLRRTRFENKNPDKL